MRTNNCTILAAILLLFLVPCASAQVALSQVLPDPTGTESGGEAVELKNYGDFGVDISGWTLRTETSATDATIPDEVFLLPGETYLVADLGWSDSRDDPDWRLADSEQSLTLKNSDSGVALYNGSVRVDAIGWGAVEDPLLFEGEPAGMPDPGQALLRQQDTDDNSADLLSGRPALGGSFPNSQTIHVSATIVDDSISITDLDVPDDDPVQSGTQWLPTLGSNRSIPVSVTARHADRVVARLGTQQVALTAEGDRFSGLLTLDPLVPPATYELSIEASSSTDAIQQSSYVTILGVVGLLLDEDHLSFDENLSTPSIRFSNAGNVPLDLGISGTDLRSGDATIPVSALEVRYDGVDSPGLVRALSSLLEILDTDILPGASSRLFFGLHPPEETIQGLYEGEITVVGVAS